MIKQIILNLGMAILMFVGCSLDNFVGLEKFEMIQNPVLSA